MRKVKGYDFILLNFQVACYTTVLVKIYIHFKDKLFSKINEKSGEQLDINSE